MPYGSVDNKPILITKEAMDALKAEHDAGLAIKLESAVQAMQNTAKLFKTSETDILD